MSNTPIVELSGTPFEMGLAHGRALKGLITEFVDSITSVHDMNNGFLKVGKKSLETFCNKNIGHLEKFAPELVEEMRGIAEGAGVTFEEILYLNCFLELEDLRAPIVGAKVLPDGLWGCTTFNVTSDAGADGRAYIGQTYDVEKYYEKFLCLLRIKPEKGPTQLVVSFAGIIGLNGMNSSGIGLVINKVTATDARPGVIYPFIVRKALSSERIGDALGAAIFSPRAGGINYQLAGSGVAFCAETSASYYQLLDIDGAIAHTNHFLGRDMRKYETPNWLSHGGSMVRKQVADNFLKKHAGSIDVDMLKHLTRDHTNYPRCICAHGFEGEDPRTAFHTAFAVIMDPEAGWMEFCPGNPCENEYERYELS